LSFVEYTLLVVAAIPFIYYFLVIYSTTRFLQVSKRENPRNDDFTPPVSCLKPIKGLDIDAYDNYASFCRQDYPEYEIVFCIDPGDPALEVIEQLVHDFPEQDIRVLFGSGREAVNDKVARLTRLTNEAKYDIFIITDGDVRVRPDYLRTVVSPFRNPKLGAATCLYRATEERTFLESLQSISMASDFFAGILVGWNLDGVKFTLAQSILTTRAAIQSFGGYAFLEDRPVDDMQVGRLAAKNGFETKLLPYVVESVADFRSLPEFLYKRVRWMTGMRFMRPWGHAGLVFTWGLPWALLAVALHPTIPIAIAYLGGYLALRFTITWLVGMRTMRQPGIWKRFPLIPLWDALAFGIWLASFTRRTIRWRGVNYRLHDGRLIAASSGAAKNGSIKARNAAGA
jgi:ceramide glucosyltransferase